MRLPISESTKKLWSRRIKEFWIDYSHNKIGMVGLAILAMFVVVAILESFIAPYGLAEIRADAPRQTGRYAYPEWLPFFVPQLRNLPRQTVYHSPLSIEGDLPNSIRVDNSDPRNWVIIYKPTESPAPVSVTLTSNFTYPYDPLREFTLSFAYSATPDKVIEIYVRRGPKIVKISTSSMNYKIELEIVDPNNRVIPIWDQNWDKLKLVQPLAQPAFWNDTVHNKVVSLESSEGRLAQKLGYEPHKTVDMASDIFSVKGVYTLRWRITFKAPEDIPPEKLEDAGGNVTVTPVKLTVWGRLWGLLGSDFFGKDVFSQVVYGARMSLMFGIAAAVMAVSMGILVGVTAGYLGGLVDEALMRIVDILICIPVLPILLVLIALFGFNVWYIALLVAIFGWQGLSRVIRSHVLSLREMAFIECAVASGASKSYIIVRHIIPNVIPTALAAMVLSVPGAVLLEASLSFLGFGDPMAPTWGKMLNQAYYFEAFSAQYLAWWVILPPGIAIVGLCLGFVFIGHAIDEIVNPKLRRRR